MKKNQTMAISVLTEAYQILLARLRKRSVITSIVAFPSFIFVPFLMSKILQIHVMTSLLFVMLIGIWCNFLSQIFSLIVFLYPKIKNFTNTVIKKDKRLEDFLLNFLKNLKRRILIFSIMSGSFLFWIFIVLWQQPEDDGSSRIIGWSDVIGVLFFCFFLSALTFKISNMIINYFLKIELNFKHNTLSSLEDFQEYQASFNQPSKNEAIDSANKVWASWDHDPMNPASAEYQSTFHRWNQDT
jgi:hypothetical protein